jgi:hypothetical protein
MGRVALAGDRRYTAVRRYSGLVMRRDRDSSPTRVGGRGEVVRGQDAGGNNVMRRAVCWESSREGWSAVLCRW